MKLLSPRRPPGAHSGHSYSYRNHHRYDTDSSSDTSSIPTTPVDAVSDVTIKPSQTIISIDILPPYSSPPQISQSVGPTSENQQWSQINGIARPSPHPRPFHTIDPTVTFIAQSSISAHSSFSVHLDGTVVHSETTTLVATGPAPGRTDGAILYSTTLAPGYWDKISQSPGELRPHLHLNNCLTIFADPTQYTILQEVFQDGPATPSMAFSAVYRFNYPSGILDQYHGSPSMSDHFDGDLRALNAQASLPFDCLLSFTDSIMDQSDGVEPFYGYADLESKSWHVSSPQSEASTELSLGFEYHNSDDELDSSLSLSPASTCFPTELSHYASNLSVPNESFLLI